MCSRGCCILTDHKWKWHAQFIALHFEDWMICPTCLCQCQVWWWHVVSLLNNSMKPITHSVRWKSCIQHYTTPWNTHKNNLYTRLLIWYITVWLWPFPLSPWPFFVADFWWPKWHQLLASFQPYLYTLMILPILPVPVLDAWAQWRTALSYAIW